MSKKLIPVRTVGFDMVFNEDEEFVTHSIQVTPEMGQIMTEQSPREMVKYAFSCLNMLTSCMLDHLTDEEQVEFIKEFERRGSLECTEARLQRFVDGKIKLEKPDENK